MRYSMSTSLGFESVEEMVSVESYRKSWYIRIVDLGQLKLAKTNNIPEPSGQVAPDGQCE